MGERSYPISLLSKKYEINKKLSGKGWTAFDKGYALYYDYDVATLLTLKAALARIGLLVTAFLFGTLVRI